MKLLESLKHYFETVGKVAKKPHASEDREELFKNEEEQQAREKPPEPPKKPAPPEEHRK